MTQYVVSSGTDWLRGVEARDSYRAAFNDRLESGQSSEEVVDEIIAGYRPRFDRLLRRARLIAAASRDRGGLSLDTSPWSEGRGATPASLTADTPEIVTSTQPYQVTLSGRALDRLREVTAVARDGDEWGGWLYGSARRSWERRIHIAFAVGGGPNADRGPHHVELDRDWRDEWDSGDPDAGTWIGNVHTHHRSQGPSDADLQAWASRFEELEARHGTQRYVALLAYPNAETVGAWAASHLRSYVVRRANTHSRRIVVEHAEIVEVNY